MKASAVAHPIQGLVKYHGLRDFESRVPYHDSISVCTAPTKTHTTVEFGGVAADTVEIDGRIVEGRESERVVRVVEALRRRAGVEAPVRAVSRSNFPKYVGLGSSASGFAALAVAARDALGLALGAEELSAVARLGAGSATRALAGGFAEWVTDGDRSFGHQLAGPSDLPWAMVAVVVEHQVPTEGVHRDVMTSPFFPARLQYLGAVLERARKALTERDAVKLMELAEADTLNLHAVTLTAREGLLAWRGATLEAMHAVRRLRRESRIPAYFSVDTGATVYVNTLPEHAPQVRDALERAVPGAQLLGLEVGGAAAGVPEHLF